jgi:hypothetical protein
MGGNYDSGFDTDSDSQATFVNMGSNISTKRLLNTNLKDFDGQNDSYEHKTSVEMSKRSKGM